MQIFAKVKYLYKCFQSVITLGQDVWDTITISITFNSLYNNFNTTIANLLKVGNKIIDQI